MKRIYMGAFLLTCCLLFLLTHWVDLFDSESTSNEPNIQTIESLYDHFNHDNPGRGLSDYDSDEAVDIPKSYAMFLIAELIRKDKNILPEKPLLYKVAGNWLLDNSTLSPDHNVGWGVPVAWDTYGDGFINPKNTIYTISNAIVIDALLDWVKKSPTDAPKNRIFQTLDKMIEPYLDDEMRTPSGLLPYSLMPNDRPYDTFNSAAYLAGQLQRYASIVSNKKYRKKLQALADQTMQSLLTHHNEDKDGSWYWHYSIQEKAPNDLPHASYIILGINSYIHNGGNLRQKFNWPAIQKHLRSFDRGGHTLYGWPAFRKRTKTPARLYDIGIAMHLTSSVIEQKDILKPLLKSVPRYRNKNNTYQKYPVRSRQTSNKGDRVVNEYLSYLYLGLISCANANMS